MTATAILSGKKEPPKPDYCRHCGHAWFRKTVEKPRQCPKCWTRDWAKGKK